MLRRAALAFVFPLWVSVSAAAQEPPVIPPGTELPPETDEDRETEAALADEEARANFEAGRIAFAATHYEDALRYFERAHELSGRHQLLYNIGLCHDRLGRDAEALAAFEGYLAAAPEAHNRAEVEQRIETARTRIARAAPPPVETPSAPPPPPADPSPWIVAGAGGAVLVAGAVLLGVGRADIASIESTPDRTRAWSAVAADVERADVLTAVGIACLGAGAVALAVGVGWGASSGGTEVRARLGPGGLVVSGSF